jgi:hypothetical protein
MPDMSDPACTLCGGALERVRYFPRQLITADDMRAEQEYFLDKLRRHNRFLHGWGVVCGCTVVPKPTAANPWQVEVCPGYVVTPQGDEILINPSVLFDLQLGMQPADPCTVTWPCPPQPVAATDAGEATTAYLAVRYVECATRPVRVHPAGCGCDQLDCEYSRIRESFELKLLWTFPKSHTDAWNADQAWVEQWKAWRAKREDEKTKDMILSGATPRLDLPVPPCPACTDDPWVVLAQLNIDATAKPPPPIRIIPYCRTLYTASAFQTLVGL